MCINNSIYLHTLHTYIHTIGNPLPFLSFPFLPKVRLSLCDPGDSGVVAGPAVWGNLGNLWYVILQYLGVCKHIMVLLCKGRGGEGREGGRIRYICDLLLSLPSRHCRGWGRSG